MNDTLGHGSIESRAGIGVAQFALILWLLL